MIIKTANIGDISSLAQLTYQLGYSADKSQIRDRLSAIIDLNDHCLYAAEINNEVVGWIHGFIAYRVESDAFVEIGGLVVDDKHQKQGVGKTLVDEVIVWAKNKSIARLRVRCNKVRNEAHTFYKRIGFEETKEQKIFDKNI